VQAYPPAGAVRCLSVRHPARRPRARGRIADSAGLAVSRWSRAPGRPVRICQGSPTRPHDRGPGRTASRRRRPPARRLPQGHQRRQRASSLARQGCPTQARSCCGLETYLSCTSRSYLARRGGRSAANARCTARRSPNTSALWLLGTCRGTQCRLSVLRLTQLVRPTVDGVAGGLLGVSAGSLNCPWLEGAAARRGRGQYGRRVIARTKFIQV
jgi:hypothetical protein